MDKHVINWKVIHIFSSSSFRYRKSWRVLLNL